MSEGIDTNKSQLLNLKKTPASFLAYGDTYLSAANILVLKKNDLDEVFKIGPIFQLSGQAFELIAKSLLLHKGVSESELRKPKKFGHDLWKLREELQNHYDLASVVESTLLRHAETFFRDKRNEFQGLTLEQASDSLRFDWQLLALNENYFSFLDENRPTYRTRYPDVSLTYKPVRLEILLPCLDCLRDFAYSQISGSTK
ncbi:hypothetical protein [Pseudophaeobacter sp.]|uniref:hypothetical protein n=1 Tax=Pseudophaeobacter sp. TaxID=1971739 RepID=UPI003299524D